MTVEWIQLAQDRGRLRTLVNTVMNLRVLAPRSWLVIVRFQVLTAASIYRSGEWVHKLRQPASKLITVNMLG
jgi:hypothetical protein